MDLVLLQSLQKIRIERKTLEELLRDIERLKKEQAPADYPTNTIADNDRVQNNKQQRTAESVFIELQNLESNLNLQRISLLASEVDGINKIYKEVKDPLDRSFLIKRFVQNKPIREMMRDFGCSRPTFYKKFEKFFKQ